MELHTFFLSVQVFSLPKVSAKTKFKLTAHEGCRVRKVAVVVFSSTAQEDYSEHTLVCLTNLGDMHLFNVPGLRPQVELRPARARFFVSPVC